MKGICTVLYAPRDERGCRLAPSQLAGPSAAPRAPREAPGYHGGSRSAGGAECVGRAAALSREGTWQDNDGRDRKGVFSFCRVALWSILGVAFGSA